MTPLLEEMDASNYGDDGGPPAHAARVCEICEDRLAIERVDGVDVCASCLDDLEHADDVEVRR